jgi:hypothetical protein
MRYLKVIGIPWKITADLDFPDFSGHDGSFTLSESSYVLSKVALRKDQ